MQAILDLHEEILVLHEAATCRRFYRMHRPYGSRRITNHVITGKLEGVSFNRRLVSHLSMDSFEHWKKKKCSRVKNTQMWQQSHVLLDMSGVYSTCLKVYMWWRGQFYFSCCSLRWLSNCAMESEPTTSMIRWSLKNTIWKKFGSPLLLGYNSPAAWSRDTLDMAVPCSLYTLHWKYPSTGWASFWSAEAEVEILRLVSPSCE